MENEIKVGEFIRTKDGRIYQVDSSKDEWALSDIFYKVIVKHSPNLIDLIQCGDYVNGKLIHKVDIRKNSSYIYYGNGKTFTDYQIETVVTKEQLESISYKVKE